jgi:glycosyl transferase family 25
MRLNDFFDQIYLINLDRRTDRMEAVHAELLRNGIEYRRVSAIDGRTISDEIHRRYEAIFEHKAEMALSNTLVSVFVEALAAGYEKILILEDDVEFGDLSLFELAVADLPEDFDLLYLGAQHKQDAEPVGPHLLRLRESYFCHAVGFSAKAMKLVSHSLPQCVCDALYPFVQENGNCYGVTPNIAFQTHSLSDISGMVANYDGVLGRKSSPEG